MRKVSWKEKKTNAMVLEQIGVKELNILNTINKRKLGYYGHLRRHDSIQKTILEGKVLGKRGRGRRRNCWTLDIQELSKYKINQCCEIAKDRRKIQFIMKSAVLSKLNLKVLWSIWKQYAFLFLVGVLTIYVLLSLSNHLQCPKVTSQLQKPVDQLRTSAVTEQRSESREQLRSRDHRTTQSTSLEQDFKEDQEEIELRTNEDTHNFTSEFDLIRDITNVFLNLDANLILAEPRILHNFISSGKYSGMKEYYSNFNFNKRLITFLIMKNTISIDSLKTVSSTLNCENTGNLNNYICKHRDSSYIILIISYIVKNDFIKFEPVTTIPQTFKTILFKNDLILGRYAGSVDWYGHYLTQEDIFVPKYFLNFLSQLRFSRYVNCNKTMADLFAKAHPKEAKRNPRFERIIKSYLKEMKRITKIVGIPFWTMAGTTLGWLRQCGIIGYSGDLDIGLWATDNSDKFRYLLESSDIFKPHHWFGSIDYGYVLRADKYLDLCFLHQDGNDSTWMGTYDYVSYAMYRSSFPMITLCSTEMLHTRILVPCNAEAMVIAEYGNNWTQPQENYSYLKDVQNLKLLKKYTADEWKSILQFYK
ncbi:Fukutin [Nymphon striatum]|nr:Fukutin [Nymphon striatum]